MRRLIRSIKGRLMLTYIILITFSFILLGTTLKYPMERYFMENIEERLHTEAIIVKNFLRQEKSFSQNWKGSHYELDVLLKEVAKDIETRITIIALDGEVLADSHEEASVMDNHRSRPEVKQAIERRDIATYERLSTTLDSQMLYLALPVEEAGQLQGVIRLALPLSSIHETLSRMRNTINLSIFFITVIAILISVRLASSITKPIEELNVTAKDIARGNWSNRAFPRTDDEVGNLANSLNYMTDTLQEKIVELETSKGKLEAVLSNMSSGVLVMDSDGKIEIVNPAAIRLLNIDFKNFKEKQSFRVFRNFELNSKIEEAIANQEHLKCELSIYHPYDRILEADIIPVVTNNKLTALIVVIHDITELQTLAQMKTEFVGNASHELRTPLTSIKGFAETLLNGAMEDVVIREKFIKIIDSEADRLIRVTDGLLDLSKAESLKGVLEKEPIDIVKTIENTLSSLNPKIIEKNLTVVLEIPDGMPKVKVNEDALTRILLNLLDNAIKYTSNQDSSEDKKIGIKVKPTQKDITIHVWDTGVGIPKEDQPRVFERFYRVDKARSRVQGGTGLGLAIAKHLVEAHKGKIGLKSTPGKGSTFWFSLPLK